MGRGCVCIGKGPFLEWLKGTWRDIKHINNILIPERIQGAFSPISIISRPMYAEATPEKSACNGVNVVNSFKIP